MMSRHWNVAVAWTLLTITGTLGVQAGLENYSEQSSSLANSIIYGIGVDPITDVEFAQMAGSMFDTGHAVPTYGATFFFQQCYSGGMFNELEAVLPGNVKWVGGSAAAHDRPSHAMVWNTHSFWTAGLLEAFTIHDSTLGLANYARLFDEAGPLGTGEYKGLDTPQTLARNQGETIDLYDPFIQEHTAILFAGHADASRHNDAIKAMYKTLTDLYDQTNRPYTILVLGDASRLPGIPVFGAATKANLAAAFTALKPLMDNRTDFLFYGTDHGGIVQHFTKEEPPVPPNDDWQYLYTPQAGLIQAILDSTTGTPQIVLDLGDNLLPGVHLFINDIDLGDVLEKTDRTEAIFELDRSMLQSFGSTIDIRLFNGSQQTLVVEKAFFRSGEIGETLLVPEPVSFSLLMLPLLALTLTRKSRLHA